MSDIDRSLIGHFSDPFDVEVEKGAIRKFAEAIGDKNPLCFDETLARRLGHAGLVAPPTFPTCFRPPKDPPWFEHLDRRRIVAGEMSFEYQRPIVAGMRLTCRMRFVGVDDKTGSRGTMELLRQELQGHDETGALVFVAGRTTVYRSLAQVERSSLA